MIPQKKREPRGLGVLHTAYWPGKEGPITQFPRTKSLVPSQGAWVQSPLSPKVLRKRQGLAWLQGGLRGGVFPG